MRSTDSVTSPPRLATLVLTLAALALPLHAIGPAGEIRATGAPTVSAVVDGGLWAVRSADGEVATSLPASATVERFQALGDGEWLLTAVDDEARIHVALGGSTATALPSPAIEPGLRVAEPTPLVDASGLDGLVWLEGADHRSSAVRAARWTGSSWSDPVTVAPPGPGTQIALDAARLADGSWLAVWAGFDGVDDEISWSRFDGDAWSTPRALTANEVPDVTPTLRVVDGRAVVAWSGFDGRDYRLHTASFDQDDRTWSTPRAFGGRGAALPTFAEADAPLVVFRQAVPGRWVVTELDDAGAPKRSTGVELSVDRPIVLDATDRGVKITWPGLGVGRAAEKSSSVVPWDVPTSP